jgi:glycolate oxidase FAD binding subunit
VPDRAPQDVLALAGRLEAVVGSDRVSLGPEAAIHDMPAPMKVRPVDDGQLSRVLSMANREHLGVCVAGGASKLGWGNRPRRFDLVLDTRGLRGFSNVDADNLSLSVAAGTPVAEARAKARAMGRLLPLDPGRPGVATVGGVTATADQGPRGAGYGGVRDVVLGLRAILADGSPVSFGGRTMKNVTGYDMTKLFIGSFGVLGVITEITYRLLPRPEKQSLIILPLASLAAAKEIVARILDSHLEPLALEVISAGFAHLAGVRAAALSAVAAAALTPGEDHLLLAGFIGHPAAVARSIAEVRGYSPGSSVTVLEDADAESTFESLSAVGMDAEETGFSLTARSTVPISQVWGLAQAADSRATAIGLPLACRIGGARGILDLYVGDASDPRSNPEELTAYVADLRRAAVAAGGELTVTDGLAALEPGFDAWGDPDGSVGLMKRVKQRFDPHCILNPGRFVGGI